MSALAGRTASPKSGPDTIRLTPGWPLAMLRAMRRIVQTIATIPFAPSGRRDLVFELLALHHQLRVLARSNRRLRSADRRLWLILRRVWPRWRDALMLVQPATVDRWSRDGFFRRWPHRTRRPGRPRIDAECRHLIQQMAAENRLWGAPRFTESSSSWESRFRNGRFPATCESARGDRHRPGARLSRITTTSSRSSRRRRPTYRARIT